MIRIIHTFPRVLLMMLFAATATANEVHHDLEIRLQPDAAHISVIDTIQFPAGVPSVRFELHGGLAVKAPRLSIEMLSESADGRTRLYQLDRLPPDGKVQLQYEGTIGYGTPRGPFSMPDAVYSEDGVYLDVSSAWIPVIQDYPWMRFTMHVDAPDGWEIISQGKRTLTSSGIRYTMPHPQNDVYLLGGPYKRHARMHGGTEIEIYLLEDDPGLADHYLETSSNYIDIYAEWIGAYPYRKFAVVENRYQTGYGMPSFTLLGSRVIRLPFILHTSLPHEILHNWWGNGVFVDASSGNWSEGLTAYMSDHFSSEQRGAGREYRRKALERYANFAAEKRDFVLADFRSRHDEASQAVGYSKSMMLFHMLKNLGGKTRFDENIRQFWQRYRFREAGFETLIRQLHPGDDTDLQAFIDQWLKRAGAPRIRLAEATLTPLETGHRLTVRIEQQQAGSPYDLRIPLDITFEGHSSPVREQARLDAKSKRYTFDFAERPNSIMVDPDFDVFRLLHPGERPSTLGRLFGASRQILVYPSTASREESIAWQTLAETWHRRYENVELRSDAEIDAIPDDAAVWVLGWNNRLLQSVRDRFTTPTQTPGTDTATINGRHFIAGTHAVILLDPDNNRGALGFIGASNPAVISRLAGKLTHYGSYGALAFNEADAGNLLKLRLDALTSPMQRTLD